MKRQDLFNKAARHLLRQNQQCLDEDDGCVYRGPDGMKCAIGALFPNAVYEKGMEMTSVSQLINDFPKVRKYLGGVRNAEFLQRLQDVHDDNNPEEWPERLVEVASEFNLSVDRIRKLKALKKEMSQ
jgi:hypothetical protein